MRLISITAKGSTRLKYTIPFDIAFIRNLEVDENNVVYFNYDIFDLQTKFLIEATSADFSIKFTNDNVFSGATVYIEGDTAIVRKYLSNADDNYGELECEVEFNEEEKKKLLLFLLQASFSKTIKEF